jgi:hypothetical protein
MIVHIVQIVHVVQWDQPEKWVLEDLMVHQVKEGLLVHLGLLENKDLTEIKVYQDPKELEEIEEIKVQMVHADQLDRGDVEVK